MFTSTVKPRELGQKTVLQDVARSLQGLPDSRIVRQHVPTSRKGAFFPSALGVVLERVVIYALHGLIGLALAGLFYLLSHQMGADFSVRFLAALSGTSAALYIGLAVISARLWAGILNLIVAIGIFTLALNSIGQSAAFLAMGFVLHGVWGLVQMLASRETSAASPSFFPGWISFNVTLTALIVANGA